jgi:hypothetical protein
MYHFIKPLNSSYLKLRFCLISDYFEVVAALLPGNVYDAKKYYLKKDMCMP